MEINRNSIQAVNNYSTNKVANNKKDEKPQNTRSYSESGLNSVAVYNKAAINFKGYYGDQQPAKKLFWILTGRNEIFKDNETEQNMYRTSCGKN